MAENFAAVAADVAAALAEVGLFVTISRQIPGQIDADKSWILADPVVISETVAQISEGRGSFRKEGVIVGSDFEFMTAVPSSLIVQPGDLLTASDGHVSTVVKVEAFPATGQAAYLTIWSDR